MTDARLPERWLNDRRVIRLSDGAFRTFVTSLVWSVANRTDGVIEGDDLDLVHGASRDKVPELVAAGLYEPAGSVHLIVDFAATQTSRDQLLQLEHIRRQEREKKARQRARKSERPSPGMSRWTPGIAQDRTGRTGRHLREHQPFRAVTRPEAAQRWTTATGRRCAFPDRALSDEARIRSGSWPAPACRGAGERAPGRRRSR
jgi:hypothetical protein